jgi:hypothetical protein
MVEGLLSCPRLLQATHHPVRARQASYVLVCCYLFVDRFFTGVYVGSFTI